MIYDQIIADYKANADTTLAYPMSAYMRHKFSFLGIKTPKRVDISREFLKKCSKTGYFDWNFIDLCFNQDEREYQYLALAYFGVLWNFIDYSDLPKLEKLAFNKPWWDTIDSLSSVVGKLSIKYPQMQDEYIRKWSISDNFWLVRWSIIYQLKFKQYTDIEFLIETISTNKSNKEFFIQKAIGWALREYAKTNPEWVSRFVVKEQLKGLSKREALKHIKLANNDE